MSDAPSKVALPNLKAALADKEGLTQRGLAEHLGIHESNISRLIKGKAKMLTREKIRIIEQYTGKTFEYLAALKEAALSEEEVDDLAALRNAPPEIQAVVRAALKPYRP